MSQQSSITRIQKLYSKIAKTPIVRSEMKRYQIREAHRAEQKTPAVRLRDFYKKSGLTSRVITLFQSEILQFYSLSGKKFPWRETSDPYSIVISEVMLAQTQTQRVLPKYEEFLRVFPNFTSLAAAPLSEVLKVWQGLGYNRRALQLQKLARRVITEHQGVLPSNLSQLLALPGIGTYTANVLLAFIYHQPSVVIETNIRTVFIYFFFTDKQVVTDKMLEPLIKATVYQKNPKDWYQALMDYGSYLKQHVGNLNKQSKHYVKQSPLEGSDRQIRARIIRLLLIKQQITRLQLIKDYQENEERMDKIINGMVKDGLIRDCDGILTINNQQQ